MTQGLAHTVDGVGAPREEPDYAAEYWPPTTGYHFCGVTPDEERPLTLASIPVRGDPAPVFYAVKAEFDEPKDDDDGVIVDLFINDDIVDDFWIRRQMLDRVKAALTDGALGRHVETDPSNGLPPNPNEGQSQ